MTAKNLLDTTNGRFLTFGILYISEGIPFGFTSIAMVAFMRQQGIPLDQIGAFAGAMFLPWAFKWAWAPLIDLIKLPRLGGRKAWILFCTSMMIVTLMVVAKIDFAANFDLLLAMIVLNNIFCATQDVAIDSLAVHALKENERGRGNGFMFGGQYLGIGLGGGAAIWVYRAIRLRCHPGVHRRADGPEPAVRRVLRARPLRESRGAQGKRRL